MSKSLVVYLLVVVHSIGPGEYDPVARDGGADVVPQRQLGHVAQRQRLVVRVQRRVHRHHARVQLLARFWRGGGGIRYRSVTHLFCISNVSVLTPSMKYDEHHT